MMLDVITKTCSRCDGTKPVTEFYRAGNSRDGYRWQCKSCDKQCRPVKQRPEFTRRPSNKHCPACQTTKPADDFYNNACRKDTLSVYCKSCVDSRRPKYTAAQQRDFALKANYGITENDYQRMLNEQFHQCAICKSTDGKTQSGRFCIDHNHETGAIRALLCNHCNRAIGLMDESCERLIAAITYLRSFSNGVGDEFGKHICGN